MGGVIPRAGVALAVAMATLAPSARAEVVSASANGFMVRHSVEVATSPEQVWETLVQPAQWWQSSHTLSGSSANLTLDLRPGGCWCEALTGGGGIEHLRVLAVVPNQLLRFAGALGPLQQYPVRGVLDFVLTPIPGAGRTRITLTYSVSDGGTGSVEGMAGPVDSVLGTQLDSLKSAAEAAVGTG
ncbi:MAG: ATPase [Sphingomonas sp.]|nr:ATPase [Sphingomonas sp.]|tara:strand:+ start:33 stop:587 length:555 start_codon:yes stop_codon:yes gene_type:complete